MPAGVMLDNLLFGIVDASCSALALNCLALDGYSQTDWIYQYPCVDPT